MKNSCAVGGKWLLPTVSVSVILFAVCAVTVTDASTASNTATTTAATASGTPTSQQDSSTGSGTTSQAGTTTTRPTTTTTQATTTTEPGMAVTFTYMTNYNQDLLIVGRPWTLHCGFSGDTLYGISIELGSTLVYEYYSSSGEKTGLTWIEQRNATIVSLTGGTTGKVEINVPGFLPGEDSFEAWKCIVMPQNFPSVETALNIPTSGKASQFVHDVQEAKDYLTSCALLAVAELLPVRDGITVTVQPELVYGAQPTVTVNNVRNAQQCEGMGSCLFVPRLRDHPYQVTCSLGSNLVGKVATMTVLPLDFRFNADFTYAPVCDRSKVVLRQPWKLKCSFSGLGDYGNQNGVFTPMIFEIERPPGSRIYKFNDGDVSGPEAARFAPVFTREQSKGALVLTVDEFTENDQAKWTCKISSAASDKVGIQIASFAIGVTDYVDIATPLPANTIDISLACVGSRVRAMCNYTGEESVSFESLSITDVTCVESNPTTTCTTTKEQVTGVAVRCNVCGTVKTQASRTLICVAAPGPTTVPFGAFKSASSSLYYPQSRHGLYSLHTVHSMFTYICIYALLYTVIFTISDFFAFCSQFKLF